MELKKVELFNETLRKNKLKIVCAESITAGLLASTIASVSGASDVLAGSIVTYNWDFKIKVLGVKLETLEAKTAESAQVTKEMCEGLLRLYPEEAIYVAVTGMASEPGLNYKGTAEVGDVFVVINYKGKLYEYKMKFGEIGRNIVREETVKFILEAITEIVQNSPNSLQ